MQLSQVLFSKQDFSLEGVSLSSRSLEQSILAASQINSLGKAPLYKLTADVLISCLAAAYHSNFTWQHASSFDAYDVFYAGTVWIAACKNLTSLSLTSLQTMYQ